MNREPFIDAAIALCDKCIAMLDAVLNEGPQTGLTVVVDAEQVPAIINS